MLELNKIHLTDCIEGCKKLDDESIDLVVTSPPYDNLRSYDQEQGLAAWGEPVWKALAEQLFRVVKQGGVVVWIVNDATIDGSETGTSFKQALHFMSCGFNLHDTMLWIKSGGGAVGPNYAYSQNFEYMFVFSKGRPKAINLIEDIPTNYNTETRTVRALRGQAKMPGVPKDIRTIKCKSFSKRNNWWYLVPSGQEGSAFHPAVFPTELARDHIISWSNKGDVVLDPFMGSGTTAVEAVKLGRKFIGFDISPEYIKGANARLKKLTGPFRIYGNIGC